jgi:hypothetical protein
VSAAPTRTPSFQLGLTAVIREMYIDMDRARSAAAMCVLTRALPALYSRR